MTLYGLLKLLKAVPWRYWLLLLFLAAIVGAQLYLRHKWVNEGRAQVLAEQADERAKAAEQALQQARQDQAKAEQLAQDFVDLAAGFLRNRTNEKAQADAVVADLRNGNLKLRREWQACLSSASQTTASSSGVDAETELRQTGVGRVHGIVGTCQVHVETLQAILMKERQ